MNFLKVCEIINVVNIFGCKFYNVKKNMSFMGYIVMKLVLWSYKLNILRVQLMDSVYEDFNICFSYFDVE